MMKFQICFTANQSSNHSKVVRMFDFEIPVESASVTGMLNNILTSHFVFKLDITNVQSKNE